METLKYPFMDEWINNGILLSHEKEKFCHLQQYRWTLLRSKSDRDRYCITSHMKAKRAKVTETENRVVVSRGRGVGEMGKYLSEVCKILDIR